MRAQVIGALGVSVLYEGEVRCFAAAAEESHGTGRERHRGVEREAETEAERHEQDKTPRASSPKNRVHQRRGEESTRAGES